MAKQRVTESKAAAQSRREVEAARRAKWYMRKETFLDSQGGAVIEFPLMDPNQIDTIDLFLLLQRVDLVKLVRSDNWPQPLTAAVRRLMMNGGRPTEDMLAEDKIEETMAVCVAITKASVIVPPPAFLSGEIEVSDITEDMCKPLFVDENPDEDQVVLLGPGGDLSDRSGSLAAGYLHPSDLMRITARAYAAGPGAAGGSFRRLREAVEAVSEVEAPAA